MVNLFKGGSLRDRRHHYRRHLASLGVAKPGNATFYVTFRLVHSLQILPFLELTWSNLKSRNISVVQAYYLRFDNLKQFRCLFPWKA